MSSTLGAHLTLTQQAALDQLSALPSLGQLRAVEGSFPYVVGIPDDLAAELRHRYGLSGRADQVAAGLSGSTMWRLDSSPPVLVRVSQQWPPLDGVQRSCAVAGSFARVVPQVPVPLIAGSGDTVFRWRESPVVLWPFIEGHPLDRNDPTHRRLAARLLANLHRAALDLDGPSTDQSAATYATGPTRSYPSVVPEDPDLDDWLRRWRDRHQGDEPYGWMHGDFFHGNILCRRENTVVGIIDWDDVQHGPLITELASAIWEFACAPGHDTLAIDHAQDFLTAYVQAGGPVRPSQDIVPLIRERLRGSIKFFRWMQDHGHELNHDNERATLAAFTSLRQLTLNL